MPTARDRIHDVRHDVITWRKNVERWKHSFENYSIEFLDLKNLENDTNKVAVSK